MLTGRDSETQRVRSLLVSARDGHGSALLVTGVAGVGKSALLSYAAEQATDFRVLRIDAVASQSTIAFAALAPLLGPRPPEGRLAVRMAIESLLTQAPTLLLVDDAQWLDGDSREAIAFVARRIGEQGVAILVALRRAPGTAPHELGLQPLQPGASPAVAEPVPGVSIDADALEATAREYAQRGGHISAAHALERAARLSTDHDARARRLVAAAEEALRAELDTRADAWANEALTLTDEPDVRTRAELVHAGVATWRGHLGEAFRRYLAIADRTPAPAAALSYASALALARGDTTAALATAEGALAHADTPHAALAAHELLATIQLLRGEIAAARASLELVDRDKADRTGAEYIALPLAWLGEYDRAAELVDAAVDAASRSGNVRHLSQALEIRADLRFRLGAWDDALADADRAADRADVAGEPIRVAFSAATAAIVHAARGDAEATHTRLERAQALVQGRGVRGLEEYTGYAYGLLALGLGDPQAALEHLLPVAEYAASTGRGTAGILFWNADLIEAAIATGRRDLAERELARLSAQAEHTGLAWATGAAARCRGLLGDDDAFATAIACHRDTPFELARSQLAYGQRLAARDGFERLGARTWADRAATAPRTA